MFGLWDMVIVAIVTPFVYKAYVYSNNVCDQEDAKKEKCQGDCNKCKCNK